MTDGHNRYFFSVRSVASPTGDSYFFMEAASWP